MAVTARYLFGLLTLLSVVLLWVASNFLTAHIAVDQDYYKPFLTTYLQTASFSLYLLPVLLKAVWNRCRGEQHHRRRRSLYHALPDSTLSRASSKLSLDLECSFTRNQSTYYTSASPTAETSDHFSDSDAEQHDDERKERSRGHSTVDARLPLLSREPSITAVHDSNVPSAADLAPMTVRETAWLSCNFCLIWFAANYANNASLGLTNVASTTILSSLSGAFTLILATCVGADTFTLVKLLSVLVSITGVSLVGYSDSQSFPAADAASSDVPRMLLGDFLSLAGAVFYAIYITYLKVRVRHEARLDMTLFFGFVGLFNTVGLLPVLGLLHVTGIEVFQTPNSQIMWSLALNAILGTFMSDYLWLLSLLMTGPVVVTLGLSLTIPLALLGDFVFKHITVSPLYLAGAVLIVLGFVGVNVQLDAIERWDARLRRYLTGQRRAAHVHLA
ncbi:hypothetical protein RI367_002394 [Sorochytrium milnesiophthora]